MARKLYRHFGLAMVLVLACGQVWAQQDAFAEDDENGEGDPLAGDVDGDAIARSSAFDDDDPWKPLNRRVHNFNEFFDSNVARPVARGYDQVTPEPVSGSVSNFFSNLGEFSNIANSVLQGKGESALISTGRFVFNSTFGLLGLFDVASSFELPEQNEDFGQTLGYWGVSSGPYVVLPFVGPSTVRDSAGMGVDYFSPSTWDVIESPDYYAARTLWAVDLRASLLPLERSITGDRYTFIRNAYLQRREYLVQDGQITDDPFSDEDDDFLDDF